MYSLEPTKSGSQCLPIPQERVLLCPINCYPKRYFTLKTIDKDKPSWTYIYGPVDQGGSHLINEIHFLVSFIAPHPDLKFTPYIQNDEDSQQRLSMGEYSRIC